MIAWISSLICVGLVSSIVLVVILQMETTESHTRECITPGCVQTASRILKDMNPEIEPCDNFYEFACGGYVASTSTPDTGDSVNRFSELMDEIKYRLRISLEEPSSPDEPRLFKLAKTLYRTCMDNTDIKELDLEPLRQTLERYGKWPVVEGDEWKEEDDFDWTESVHTSRELGYSINNFITLDVVVDWKDTTKYILSLKQPSFSLPRKLLAEGAENDRVQAYFKHMVSIAMLLGADEQRATQELEESLRFQISLANITDRYLYRISIAELGKQYPSINWEEYINNLLPPNVRVDANEIVTVSGPNSINGLEKLLTNTPRRVQANYALWRVAEESFRFLTKNQSKRQMESVSTASKNIVTGSDYRWQECVANISESSLSIITNALYVRKYFEKGTRQEAVKMVADIKKEMIEILKKTEWMGDRIRSIAMEKATSILSQVAYPVEFLDDKELEKFYTDPKLGPNDSLGNVLHLNQISLNHSLGLLRKPVNKSEWVTHDFSTQVNAFYSPTENSIYVPAGILQGTFFGEDRPHYMNYGAIGFLIGHEISHSFGPKGRKFDKDGKLVDWWTPETAEKYLQKVQCIIDQYRNYTVESVGMKLDGNKTLGENVADNVGIKTAYLAYKEYVKRNGPEPKLPGLEYTPEQMFWISAANTYCIKYRPQEEELMIRSDVHSPGRFRVIGSFANSQEFAADFNCPSGTYMNPVHKCSVM